MLLRGGFKNRSIEFNTNDIEMTTGTCVKHVPS